MELLLQLVAAQLRAGVQPRQLARELSVVCVCHVKLHVYEISITNDFVLQIAAAATGVAMTGPVGWCILGATCDDVGTESWDCWKQVVRDHSTTPSLGAQLSDILVDKRVKSVTNLSDGNIRLTNVWNEEFDIKRVILPDGTHAAHATRLLT